MANKGLSNKKSKRLTCKRRYKIEKKVREHTRKVRKETKEKLKSGKFLKKKPDIQVPNKCPFKEDILKEAQEQKKVIDEAKQKRIEEIKAKRKEARENLVAKKRGNLHSLVENAESKGKAFEASKNLTALGSHGNKTNRSAMEISAENSLKSYYSEVKKVLDKADVIVEVLDARDPLGTRCHDVETTVVESGKRLVLLLNKIDLIPKENVQGWMKYLRNEFPCVAFKASTQEQTTNLGRAGHCMIATSKCVGADILMKLFGNYCRNKDIKTSICIGIVGFPNVGKSSVINSLKRKSACNVGAAPGITKNMQEIHLDKKIRLLDSPGVVLASKSAYDPIEMALKNTIRIELLEDPTLPVEAILRRCTKDSLMLQYNIPEFSDLDEFLCLVARKIGRLKKGGVPDRRMAAKKILADWNGGKIRYYTEPPEIATGVKMLSAELITEMSKEFDLESIDTEQQAVVQDLPFNSEPDVIVLPSWKDSVALQPMEIEKPVNFVKVSRSIVKSTNKTDAEMKETVEDRLDGNKKLNKAVKLKFKKDKKKRKRADKLATNLSDALESAMDIDKSNYDFEIDFK